MTCAGEGAGGSANWSRTRLVVMKRDGPMTVTDEAEIAVENQLALCRFSYGPMDTRANGSDRNCIWGVTSSDDCSKLLVVDSSQSALVVNGYILPIAVLLTLVTNSLVCAVLLQRHMRTPTNIFLMALAVSDALTGAIPLPVFIYFYLLGAYRYVFVPPGWCHTYLAMTLHLPTAWHTASIWLTVGLAFQRYIYVCHQQAAKRLCILRNAVIAVGSIYVAAIVSQLPRSFDYHYESIDLSVPLSSADVQDSAAKHINITGCYMLPLLAQHNEVYFSTYWYLRITFINVIPCVMLVGLNARLLVAMRRAQAQHTRLLQQNLQSEYRRVAETNMATLMLVVVVGVFLLVEVPLAVLMMTMIVENTFDPLLLIDPDVRRTATLIINLIILFSYPVNFFIYCIMSQQFRQTFCRLFGRYSSEEMPDAPRPLHGRSHGPEVDDLNDETGLSAIEVHGQHCGVDTDLIRLTTIDNRRV